MKKKIDKEDNHDEQLGGCREASEETDKEENHAGAQEGEGLADVHAGHALHRLTLLHLGDVEMFSRCDKRFSRCVQST